MSSLDLAHPLLQGHSLHTVPYSLAEWHLWGGDGAGGSPDSHLTIYKGLRLLSYL